MPDLAPSSPPLRVQQSPRKLSRPSVDALDQLIIVTPAKLPGKGWGELPDGNKLKALARGAGADPGRRMLHSRLANRSATRVTLGRLPEDSSDGHFSLLRFAGELAADALRDEPRSIGLVTLGLPADAADDVGRAVALALGAHSFQMPTYASAKKRGPRRPTLKLFGFERRLDLKRCRAEIEATNLARWLTALPPNKLDAKGYREFVEQLAEENGWKMEFLDEPKLRQLGAGAFLAVAQGNAAKDAGIAHLRYRPGPAKEHPSVALVGKGIIFDTGGNNIKPFKAMLDMHQDMAGSAVALSILLALTRLKFPHAVDCWLAITENRVSANAYKSRDVLTAANGTTIEAIHTDAEGRMVLADTLALASREKPSLILDYATLTGSCVHALTERYSGVFSNRPALNPLLIEIGRETGERVWPFPMDTDYEDDLKSGIADILQCALDGSGDHIHAARFLKRFVPDAIPWVHMDLSSASRKAGLGQVPSGPTGFGVRYSLSLILDHEDALKQAANG